MMYNVHRGFNLTITVAIGITTFAAAVTQTSQPAEVSGPVVLSTDPPTDADDVPLGSNIVVNFSDPMDATTLNGKTVLLNDQPLAEVKNTAVILPDPEGKQAVILLRMDHSQVYNFTLTTGIKDATGRPLARPFSWTFKASAHRSLDHLMPEIVARYPRENHRGIPTNAPVCIVWNTAMNVDSLNRGALSLIVVPATEGGTTTPIPVGNTTVIGPGKRETLTRGRVEAAGTRTVFRPHRPLAPNTIYEVRLAAEAATPQGNKLEEPLRWRFTTGDAPSKAPILAEAWIETITREREQSAILSVGVVPGRSPVVVAAAAVGELRPFLTLHDSGDFETHGDKYVADGIFAGRYTFAPEARGGRYKISFLASARDHGQAEPVTLTLDLPRLEEPAGSSGENGPLPSSQPAP